MCEITRTDLQNLVNAYINTPTTCRVLCAKLNAIWQSAEIDGVVQKNIAANLNRPKYAKTEKRPLTKEELDAIKIADFTPQQRLMVDILLQFGLRPAEAFALDTFSVDRKNRNLIINKALAHKDQMPVIKTTKTGVTRILPIPDEMLDRLKPFSDKTTYFFTDENGHLYTRWGMNRFQLDTIAKINKAMGGNAQLKKTSMTFYNFRHHKASLLYYLAGVSLKAKAAYLGHSEELFLRTYSHMMQEKEDTEVLRQIL